MRAVPCAAMCGCACRWMSGWTSGRMSGWTCGYVRDLLRCQRLFELVVRFGTHCWLRRLRGCCRLAKRAKTYGAVRCQIGSLVEHVLRVWLSQLVCFRS